MRRRDDLSARDSRERREEGFEPLPLELPIELPNSRLSPDAKERSSEEEEPRSRIIILDLD